MGNFRAYNIIVKLHLNTGLYQDWTLDCTTYLTLVAKAQCVHVLRILMSKLPHLKRLCWN